MSSVRAANLEDMHSGDRIALGVLTPHAAGGPRAEIEGMAAGHVRVHVSRTRSPQSCASSDAGPSTLPADLRARAAPAALDQAAAALPPALDVLAFASTSTAYAIGYDDECALVRRLRQRWGLPVCTPTLSAVSALRSHGMKRISLVHPPWFGPALNALGVDYFRSQGFDVIEAQLADLPDDTTRIEPTALVDWVTQHLSHRAEAVVIGGNGFRAAPVIHELESRTGCLVLEANQVLLKSVLDHVAAAVPIHGFGTLFDDLTQCRDRTGGHQRPYLVLPTVHLARNTRIER